MVAIRKDLTADQGSTFNLSIQYTDSNEVPVNLTGYGALCVIKTPRGVTVQTIAGTVTSLGWINIKATDEQTLLWPLGRQSYYLDLLNPAGDNDRLFIGTINVRSAVTV